MARLASVEETVAHVLAEVRPDHGKSFRDLAGRIEGDVSQIRTDQGEMRRRMELFETERAVRED